MIRQHGYYTGGIPLRNQRSISQVSLTFAIFLSKNMIFKCFLAFDLATTREAETLGSPAVGF